MRVEAERDLDSGDTLRVLSHLVGEQRHYGVVIVPAGDRQPWALPALGSLIGFGREMVLDVPDDARAYEGEHITILRVGNESWRSDGDPYDQCDGGRGSSSTG